MAGTTGVNESKMVVPLNTWILISNFKLAYNLLRRPDGTFIRHLAEFLDRKVLANANPVNGVFSFDVVIDSRNNLLVRVYRPADDDVGLPGIADLEKPLNSDIVPVIVFFHGGSFAHSSANSAIYDTLCRRLVDLCKAVVISVNYRRAPEDPYPCAYDDGWTALKWVHSRKWLQSREDSKIHIYLAGDSSGGNIVHNVALRAAESGIELLGNILLNPMFGGQERTESEKRFDGKYFVTIQDRDWYWRAFLPEGEDRDHPACNPFGPRTTNIEGISFPKSLVVVAGLDLVQDWQIAYCGGLKKAGKEVKLLYLEKATIGFYLLPNNDHFYTVMDEIKSFSELTSIEGEDRDHPACNPFGPRTTSIEGISFPKSLVVVAGLDLVQDRQIDYAGGLKKAGKEVKLSYLEKATTVFYLLPNNDHFYTVMDEIKSFVSSDCGLTEH